MYNGGPDELKQYFKRSGAKKLYRRTGSTRSYRGQETNFDELAAVFQENDCTKGVKYVSERFPTTISLG
jgi:hypothetical protein